MTGSDWKEHQCIDRARNWEEILSSQGSLSEGESRALAEVREFIENAKATTESFELLVADCLPDDDDGGEEPGEMCRRALAKAEASGPLIKKVAILVSGADDLADFEQTYGEEDQQSLYATAFEIIKLVRAMPAPGTITLSRDQFTSALREAAAQGMDNTSGPSCEEAASCRQVADEIVEVWSPNPSWNGQTMVIDRRARS